MADSLNKDVASLGMGLQAGGGVAGAIGSISGGISQQQMYNYQAGIARLNAQIAEQNATYAEQVGENQAQRAGLQAQYRLGRTKVSQASSGLDVNSGSPKQVYNSQRLLSQMDIAAIRSDAAKTAYDYRVQGVQLGAQANLDTIAGQNARISGLIGADSSIVGAASSLTGTYLRGAQLGMFGGGGGNNSLFGS